MIVVFCVVRVVDGFIWVIVISVILLSNHSCKVVTSSDNAKASLEIVHPLLILFTAISTRYTWDHVLYGGTQV